MEDKKRFFEVRESISSNTAEMGEGNAISPRVTFETKFVLTSDYRGTVEIIMFCYKNPKSIICLFPRLLDIGSDKK